MYFKIGKKIFIHKSFLFLPLIIYTSNNINFYLLMLFFAFLHEVAHFITAKLLKKNGESLFIFPYGFELRLRPSSAAGEAAVLLSGPLISLFLSIIFYLIGEKNISKINVLLFIINVLPAFPLDGGRLLRLLLWKAEGSYRGNMHIKIISRCTAVLILMCSAFARSLWLIIIAFLIFSKSKKLNSSPFYKKRSKIVPVKTYYVAEKPCVMDLLRLFSPYYYICVYIGNSSKAKTEGEIVEYAEKHGCNSVLQ